MKLQTDERLILGLDLGTSSVGWALLAGDETGEPTRLVDMGVRHFQEVIKPKDGTLKNAERRMARGMRRNIARDRMRREKIARVMQDMELIPEGDHPFANDGADPYGLRAKALTEPLAPGELARAIFHLGKKRGFKSNRGAKMASLKDEPEILALLATESDDDESLTAEQKKELGTVLKELKELNAAMAGRTLGQYLYDEIKAGNRVVGRHKDRSMVQEEFERIYAAQAKFHPVLTEANRVRLSDAIFYQRPLKQSRGSVAYCALEKSKKVADRARLVSQEFRIWNEITNLRFTATGTRVERPLTQSERDSLAALLGRQKSATWSGIKKHLRLPKGEFNLERSQEKELKGNQTSFRLAKILGEDVWERLGRERQTEIVEWILTARDRGTLYRTLRRHFEVKTAYELALVELPQGTANLSERAMRRMLEYMQQGMSKTEAQEACGYLREDQKPPERHEVLPPMLTLQQIKELSGAGRHVYIHSITSPRVRKALNQVRLVVNELIRTYGPIHTVRIEMARSMKLNKKQLAELEKTQKANLKANEEARAEYRGHGIEEPTRLDLMWYRLGKECNWICPYSGKAIPKSEMGVKDASARSFQIEHIIPYSILPSDEFSGLTLCHVDWNLRKGKRLPSEAFTGQELEDMRARIDQLKGPGSNRKKKLFASERKDLPELAEFINRQLNETSWICREAAQYLRLVAEDVSVAKGATTSMLCARWKMHAMYGDGTDKDRGDLRHHAADALAVAFTSRSLYGRLIANAKARGEGSPLTDRRVVPDAPEWLFAQASARFATVIVSHETTRGITGALHKETAYGRTGNAYHLRTAITDLRLSDVKDVIDSKMREMIQTALVAAGDDAKRAFPDGFMEYNRGDGVTRQVRKVKCVVSRMSRDTPQVVTYPNRHFLLGNNHHVEVFETLSGHVRRGQFVTAIEAARRVRIEKIGIYKDKDLSVVEKYLWSLHGNDMIQTDDGNIYRVAKLEPTGNRAIAFDHRDSGQDPKWRLFVGMSRRDYRRIEVNPIGKIREPRE